MGTPQAAVPSLERCLKDGHEIVAVYTQPDRPSGRGNKITFSPVKDVALQNGLDVFQPLKIKTQESIQTFRSHDADVAVVVAYGRILPESYLTAFSQGAINVHFSLLPKYRGAAPVNWAIVNGETESGVTTMRMDEGLDTGDILLQERTAIGDTETSIELMSRLSELGAELLSKTLGGIDTIKPIRQDSEKATFAPIMRREDGAIDWQASANAISDRVRGFQPFPSTHTIYRGQRLTLWNAVRISSPDNPGTQSGEIVQVHGDIMIVRAGEDSYLRINEIQPEGKRRMGVRDFINGSQPKVGEILGV